MKKISLWSGPRNISTAIMYSFAQRYDTQVVDEPLYVITYVKQRLIILVTKKLWIVSIVMVNL